jgi:hypothetical protein
MMSDVNASGEVEFPWLPGEVHILADPALAYRNDTEPPQHLMITLAKLAQGHDPMDTAPAEFLSKIHITDYNESFYVIEFVCRYAVWNEQSQSFNWCDADGQASYETRRTELTETLLQRFWTYYAQLVQSDLNQRGETSKEALERIQRQWREWSRPRIEKFTAKWIDAAAWPPALAFSWIMFTGDWRRIAGYLKYGQYIPTSGWFLKGLSVHPDAETAKHAANKLMRALRAKAESSNRVIVRARLNGQGPMLEISPIDLATLDWALVEPSHASNAVLERQGAVYYSDVQVDANSLIAAIPANGMIDKELKKVFWLANELGGRMRRISAQEGRELARKWLTGQGLETDEAAVKLEGDRLTSLARRYTNK